MENYKSLQKKYKERYYVITSALDDVHGNHSKTINPITLIQ